MLSFCHFDEKEKLAGEDMDLAAVLALKASGPLIPAVGMSVIAGIARRVMSSKITGSHADAHDTAALPMRVPAFNTGFLLRSTKQRAAFLQAFYDIGVWGADVHSISSWPEAGMVCTADSWPAEAFSARGRTPYARFHSHYLMQSRPAIFAGDDGRHAAHPGHLHRVGGGKICRGNLREQAML